MVDLPFPIFEVATTWAAFSDATLLASTAVVGDVGQPCRAGTGSIDESCRWEGDVTRSNRAGGGTALTSL